MVYVATTFIYPEGSCHKTRSRFVIQRAVQKKSSHENRGKTYKKRIPVLLRRRRLGRRRLGGRLLGASRRIRVPRGGFRCSRTRCVSRDRRRGRGSWTCRRRDSFSFLLARCEKRARGENADVFLHSWRGTLL